MQKLNADEKTKAVQKVLTPLAEKLPAQLQESVDVLKSVRASLDLATDMFRTDMVEFTKELPTHLEKLRAWRQTMEREKDITLKALKDMRQFFLGDDHNLEMQRLNEFVRTCERLAVLAKDGTLEKVADVMLKLA